MRHIVLIILCILLTPLSARAELPLTIAGITLGQDIEQFRDFCMSETEMGLRDQPFLNELSIDPSKFDGMRGGSIDYGNCQDFGRIVRLKLKFQEQYGRDLFNKLLKLYKKELGEPDAWKGNVFHTIVAWEWTIREGDEFVEILLMYSEDPEVRPGVSIKATYRSQWHRERLCYTKMRHRINQKALQSQKSLDLGQFLPQ